MKVPSIGLTLIIAAAFLFSCSDIPQNGGSSAEASKNVTYYVDTETCKCRTYEWMTPPPPPPDHPIEFDSVLTGNRYEKYMIYASIKRLAEDVLVRGVNYDLFELKMWDSTAKWRFSNRKTILHPWPRMCYFTLELRHDSSKGLIYIGYDSEGSFHSFYEIGVDDSEYEGMMKEDTANARSVVYGNMYLTYKKTDTPGSKAPAHRIY